MWMGCDWSTGYIISKSILGVLFFAAASFVFSLVFWLTHEMVLKGKKRK